MPMPAIVPISPFDSPMETRQAYETDQQIAHPAGPMLAAFDGGVCMHAGHLPASGGGQSPDMECKISNTVIREGG